MSVYYIPNDELSGWCSSAPCSPNATCVDVGEKFSCNCNEGYRGDGFSCEGYVEVNASIRTNEPFEEELLDESSPQYKSFETYATQELTKVFGGNPKFSKVVILGFRNGSSSVEVDFLVVYKSDTPTSTSGEVATVAARLEIASDSNTNGNFIASYSVNEAPPPPSQVSFENVKQSELLLKWIAPDRSHIFSILSYHIEYHIVGESLIQKAEAASTESNILLSNLKSDTFYNIFVLCENKFGKGERSKNINVKTLQESKGNETIIIIAVIVAVVVFAIAFIVGCLIARHRRSRNRQDSSNTSNDKGKGGEHVISYGSRPYPPDWSKGNQQEMYYINEVQSVRSGYDSNNVGDDDIDYNQYIDDLSN